MRILEIKIEKLFGLFNHSISLNSDERITIIHGPNGVGKTTLLKLVGDLFEFRLKTLFSTPYAVLKIVFENNDILKIKKHTAIKDADDTTITATLTNSKSKKAEKYEFGPRDGSRKHIGIPSHLIDEFIPHLKRVGPRRWMDRRNGKILSFSEVLYRYDSYLPSRFKKFNTKDVKWFRETINAVSTYFIQTQRLFTASSSESDEVDEFSEYDPETKTKVQEYSKDMTKLIQTALRESGSVGASLDRKFPHRLMSSSTPRKATTKWIREKYQEQMKYRTRLMEAGLIEPEKEIPLPSRSLKPNERKVLWHYLNDVDKKFEVFKQLLEKVELFKDIINTRFLFKEFIVSKSDGFVFTSKDEKKVPLVALSSGEQHELVLAYQLLFKTKEKSLILIDEPELSLHVTWQHKFLEDIARISKLADLDFLIATHSPSIIHNRRDLMVDLKGI